MLFVCEMVFEASHQPLKFQLSRNHTAKSHIRAVHMILAKDWLQRVTNLWLIYNSGYESEQVKHFAFLGLVWLFGGEQVDKVKWSESSTKPILSLIREHLNIVFKGEVEKRLKNWYNESRMTYDSIAKWDLVAVPKSGTISKQQKSFFDLAKTKLSQCYGEDEISFNIHLKALLRRGYGSNTFSPHERLELGDIVQLLVKEGNEDSLMLDRMDEDTGQPFFFVIGCFIKTPAGDSWIVVKRCKFRCDRKIGQIPDFNADPVLLVLTPNMYDSPFRLQFIKLSYRVRKVGVQHDCSINNSCHFRTSSSRELTHSETTLGGGQFFLHTRSLGYPPRRS